MTDTKANFFLVHIDDAEPFAESSNTLKTLTHEGISYICKQQRLADDALSPFWATMRSVYGSTFAAQRRHMPTICAIYQKNPYIPAASLAFISEEKRLQVFTKMPGNAWEPDEFPESEAIAYQLGQWAGFNHSHKEACCGLPGANHIADIHTNMVNAMQANINAHWNDDTPLCVATRKAFETLRKQPWHSAGYAPIMTDISANQFLFGKDSITACVDFDACVIGPVEWELTLLEHCVPTACLAAFQNGYKQHLPYPEIDVQSRFYQFLMALNDIWGRDEMREYLEQA